jgi:hypothetical protein
MTEEADVLGDRVPTVRREVGMPWPLCALRSEWSARRCLHKSGGARMRGV